MRRLVLLPAVVLALAAVLIVRMDREVRTAPLVRRAVIAMPDWPAGAAPLRVALLSDLHLGNRAMDGARLTRIMDQVAALAPDLVLIAGDLIDTDATDAADLIAPLRRLRPPLGIVAVPGNHDRRAGLSAVRAVLTRAGVVVLANGAVVRGPLALGGLDDDYTGHDDLPRTVAAIRRLPGARLLLAHTPDRAPQLPGDVSMMVAGHTHCGQLVLPVIGAPISVSRHGDRYRCGVVREGRRTVVVTAGLGASTIPLRFGAPPDFWLLTLGPPPRG